MAEKEIMVSSLPKTWILDLDGTIVKHNGYKIDGKDTLLQGAKRFFQSIADEDMIIFITSRDEKYKKETEDFLHENHIRYNNIIYNAPYGERILINDRKPSGLCMAKAISPKRDEFMTERIVINEDL